VEFIETFEYNAEGQRIRETETRDLNEDGTTDSINTWEFNDEGQQIRQTQTQDWDADGTVDRMFTLEYYDQGQRIREMETRDLNDDGTPDRIETNEYNDQGHRSVRTVDTDGDGTIDSITFEDVDSRFDFGTVADRADISILDLDNTSAQVITLTSDDLVVLAGDDMDYVLEIRGDSNDVLQIFGLTETHSDIPDTRGTQYEGPVGSIFIDTDITVELF